MDGSTVMRLSIIISQLKYLLHSKSSIRGGGNGKLTTQMPPQKQLLRANLPPFPRSSNTTHFGMHSRFVSTMWCGSYCFSFGKRSGHLPTSLSSPWTSQMTRSFSVYRPISKDWHVKSCDRSAIAIECLDVLFIPLAS